ncbi:MAG: beta-propeller fold lactonase family protein [Acidobacteriaceae bacterium]
MKSPILRIVRCSLPLLAAAVSAAQTIHLPSSKEILPPVPGSPRALNSLPMTAAWSPDHRYLALVNAGYGTAESNYEQSVAILDTVTGRLTDFPDPRTGVRAPQSMYSGIAFSPDGRHLFVSFDSLTAPDGVPLQESGHAAPHRSNQPQATGNGVAVYGFAPGSEDSPPSLTPERLIHIPLRRLMGDQIQHHGEFELPKNEAIPAPAGLAVVPGKEERLLVADEFSDDAALLDAATGKLLTRFDLSAGPVIPSTYPVAVVVGRRGRRAWVSLWNGSAVAELDLRRGKVVQRLPLLPPTQNVDPSSHPVAMALSPDRRTLYVALANRDAVAAVRIAGHRMRLDGFYDTRLPGQTYFGAMPDAVAVSPDGHTLFAANSGSDAVAVFDLDKRLRPHIFGKPLGFIPTEWYPTAIAAGPARLFVATAKGKGTGPNVAPQPIAANPAPSVGRAVRRPHTYIATMLHGSLASIDLPQARAQLPKLTAEVMQSNLMNAAQQTVPFRSGANPIRHVIYIIKENRTYDQILGDLGAGNGDPSLTMYGENITPNEHALARQFGVLDNFYDSGEVSGDGHVWSTAAINSDYLERTWQVNYRGGERPYDFEGVVEEGFPLLEHIPDVDEPESGYIWTDLARHNISYFHFAEYISTQYCNATGAASQAMLPQQGGTPEGVHDCSHPYIHHGDPIPARYGGGVSRYPWNIPFIYKDVATKPALVGHFDPDYPDFGLDFPDQLRVNEFLNYFRRWTTDLSAGHDTMPAFVMLRLPNDHTAGTRPGWPTPEASVADNDLAVGRVADLVSHSAYWDSTAIFILEDDAQDGADHVDAHRSVCLVISKYAPHRNSPGAAPYVDSRFYTTVSTVHTILTLLGAPPMNNNDALAPLESPEFSGAGDQPPYTADYRNEKNGLIYQANTPRSPGAKESARMDFTHEDRAPAGELNLILWKEAMGDKPVPYLLLHPFAPRGDKSAKDDDDGD